MTVFGTDLSEREETRFWSKVNFLAADGHWLWIAGKTTQGYGSLRAKGVHHYAHRRSYELSVGPIPDGLTIDHTCRTRACVNPSHLEPVPLAENIRRAGLNGAAEANAAKTECRRGHPLSGENLRIVTLPGGATSRRCVICARRRSSDYAARQRRRGARP